MSAFALIINKFTGVCLLLPLSLQSIGGSVSGFPCPSTHTCFCDKYIYNVLCDYDFVDLIQLLVVWICGFVMYKDVKINFKNIYDENTV